MRPPDIQPARVSPAPPPRTDMNAHEQVMRFGAWLRVNDGAGWYTAFDILEFYEWFAGKHGLAEIDPALLLERFAVSPGVWRGRRRMNEATGDDMAKLRLRLKSQSGCTNPDRPTLYRVASAAEMQATLPAVKAKRGTPSGGAPATPSAKGRRPVAKVADTGTRERRAA